MPTILVQPNKCKNCTTQVFPMMIWTLHHQDGDSLYTKHATDCEGLSQGEWSKYSDMEMTDLVSRLLVIGVIESSLLKYTLFGVMVNFVTSMEQTMRKIKGYWYLWVDEWDRFSFAYNHLEPWTNMNHREGKYQGNTIDSKQIMAQNEQVWQG